MRVPGRAPLTTLALCAAVLSGCSGGPQPAPPEGADQRVEPPVSMAADPPRARARFDTWTVGADPLPLRPDGYGQVLPTPAELRVRRLRTVDALPPPEDDRFEGEVRPLTAAVVRRTGLAWSPGCPVALADLRLLELPFWGFDGRPHTGRLVVAETVARDVVAVFGRLHAARFPIEEMRLVTQADLDAPPTGDGNNTAAYACRPAVGSTTWSSHARGLAVDLNPFMNPYRRDDLVLPELASAYLDRSRELPGMIRPDGVVVRAFAAVGWTWGGTFATVDDPHHFSADGR